MANFLTPKMRSITKISPACLAWLPLDEGAGNDFSSRVGTIEFSTTGAAHNIAHSPVFVESLADVAEALVAPSGSDILMFAGWTPNTSTAFVSFTFGKAAAGISRVGFQSGLTAIAVDDDDTIITEANFVTPVLGQNCFVGIHIDGVTGDLTTYDSINNAVITANTPVAGTPLSDITIDLTEVNGLPINNTLAQATFGAALWATSDRVNAADRLTWFEEMRANWVQGYKIHPVAMYGLKA